MNALRYRIESHPPVTTPPLRPYRHGPGWVDEGLSCASLEKAIDWAMIYSDDHPDRFVRILEDGRERFLMMPPDEETKE